jgi:hypothetical protein
MFVPFAGVILAHIYQQFTASFPQQANKIFSYAGLVFVLVLGGIIAAPFFINVSLLWAGVLALVVAALLYFYYRKGANKIWLFITGIIIARLVYAVLFIPLEYEQKYKFAPGIGEAVNKNERQPVAFWAPAETFPVAIKSRLINWNFEETLIPPVLSYQVSYYYFKNTGHLVRFDTAFKDNHNYVSFKSHLHRLPSQLIKTNYVFDHPKQNDTLVFYKTGLNK